MKKSRIIITIAILLILTLNSFVFILAEETTDLENQDIARVSDISGANDFKNSTNKFLANEITLPENLKIFSKILLGVKEGETIEVSNLIILFALFIIILIIIQSLLEIIPFFGEGWKSWIGAMIITCLTSTSGGIKDAAIFIFDLKRLFGWLGNYSFFFIVLNLVILFILAWGGKELLHSLKQKIKKETKEAQGFQDGAGI